MLYIKNSKNKKALTANSLLLHSLGFILQIEGPLQNLEPSQSLLPIYAGLQIRLPF
jgi:hypothetical protein